MADLTATQQVTASLVFKDRKGNVVANPEMDGVPAWTTSDETVATVVPSADGLSALIVAGAPGSGRVVAQVDVDLGEGQNLLIGTLDVNVTPGAASVVALEAGTPEEQP